MGHLQRILSIASNPLDKKGLSTSSGSGKTDWREIVRTAANQVTGYWGSPANVATGQSRAATQMRGSTPAVSPEDHAAVARYDYLLRTASPEQLEQVHRDAFGRLTPAQREQLDAQVRAQLPAGEQPASASPEELAQSAARGDARNPGLLRKLFATPTGRGAAGAVAGAGIGAAAGVGLGAAGGLLAAVAGGEVLSSVAAPLLEQAAGMGVDFESLAGGLDGSTEGAGEYATDLGPQASDLGSNFERPGLSGLGSLFGRD